MSTQDGAAKPQDQAPGKPEAEASLDRTKKHTSAVAARSEAETLADNDFIQPSHDLGNPVSEAAPSVPKAETSVPSASAGQWGRAADLLQFD